MGIKLIGVDGPMRGRERELEVGTYTVGRGPGCDVRLENDGNASREHAILRVRDGVAEVEDKSSTNGTWVNDIRVLQERVTEGDTLRIGDSVFHVESIHGGGGGTEPPEVLKAEVHYAGFWVRLASRIIDFVVVTLLYGLLGGFLGLLFWKYAWALIDFERNLTGTVVYGFVYIVVWLVAYPAWMDGTSGQTIGRMCTGIWISTEDRERLIISEAVARHALFVAESLIMPGIVYGVGSLVFAFASGPKNGPELLDAFLSRGAIVCGGLAAFTYFLLYYILLAADSEKRGWHDKSAGTVVLHK